MGEELGKIRRAGKDDIPVLGGLLGHLFAQEAEFVPDPEKQARGLRMILDQPDSGLLLVAETADGVVGMVSVLFSISTAEGGRVGWLEDMIVDPAHRGTGIGQRLLRSAIKQARTAGCLRLTLLTDSDNIAAVCFYTRAGFIGSPMIPLRMKL
ncbi:GNAT family N-acetyltransferase [Haloferula sargassicola]|uniref:Mycothiol acetyltransferase n=1 Tax=Haloferula sargassicola TaxID=490096 RepID=A0ABP9UPU7_9BACT